MGRSIRSRALVIATLVGLLGAVGAVSARSGRQDFTVSAVVPVVTAPAGQAVAFPVTVSRLNNFSRAVSVDVTGAPAASRLTVSPARNRSVAAAVVSVQTVRTTPPGSYPLRLTASSGSLSHTVSATLVVTAASSSGFAISASPANANVPQGTVAVVTIAISRTRFTAPVSFTAANVPPGAGASFTPVSTSGDSTVLQVATTGNTPQGSYDVVVRGAATVGLSSVVSTTTVHLTVSAPMGNPKQFTISGNADRPVVPGVSAELDLAITNPNNQTLDVTALVVTVTATSTPSCPPSAFAVGQFTGRYPVSVPPNATRTLSQLGVSPAALPTLALVETGTNQNACKGARLTLGYAGSGTGA